MRKYFYSNHASNMKLFVLRNKKIKQEKLKRKTNRRKE